MKTLRNIFLLLGCLHLAVGSLNCLQFVAWAKMLHDYSGERSLTEAADMTFSGEFPCSMCRTIAVAKFEEAENQKTPHRVPDEDRSLLRPDFQPLAKIPLPRVDHWQLSSASPSAGQELMHASSIEAAVPTPPPRGLA